MQTRRRTSRKCAVGRMRVEHLPVPVAAKPAAALVLPACATCRQWANFCRDTVRRQRLPGPSVPGQQARRLENEKALARVVGADPHRAACGALAALPVAMAVYLTLVPRALTAVALRSGLRACRGLKIALMIA